MHGPMYIKSILVCIYVWWICTIKWELWEVHGGDLSTSAHLLYHLLTLIGVSVIMLSLHLFLLCCLLYLPTTFFFYVIFFRFRTMASPIPGFRHVSVFTRWGCDTYAQPPTRRARVSLFTRYLAQILSGVDAELACLRPSFRVHLCANMPSKRWEIPLRETPTTLPRIAQD